MDDRRHAVDVVKAGPDGWIHTTDLAAAEEPLEIRLNGEPFVVTMRTPGADVDLVAGFLLSERVVHEPSELAAIDRRPDDGLPHTGNVIYVTLAGDAARRLPSMLEGRRHVTANSSCGVCGRRTIASLMSDAPPVDARFTVTMAVLTALPDRLRDHQHVFDETGGLHAAGLFTLDGTLEAAAEDVGRHNAVDKVVGKQLRAGRLPLSHSILFVSGRTSYEIVQKALMAGIPLIAAVSAPSTLAIDLARHAGITLVGFVRDGRLNIYTHPDRVGT